MPYFHATRRTTLPSIRRLGLGGVDIGATSETCDRGVYLGSDPRLCLAVMLQHYLNAGDAAPPPSTELGQWVVLVVDDARIDRGRLAPDPQVRDWMGSWLYRGVIDMPVPVVLTPEQILSAAGGSLPESTGDAWLGF